MKKSRLSQEQMAYTLKLADTGQPVPDVWQQVRISEATFYVWKRKYADLGVAELRQLRQLTEENARLKRVVADLLLDKQVLREEIKKKGCEADAPAGGGSLDAGAVSGERQALLRVGQHHGDGVVLPQRCPGSKRAAHAHSRDRASLQF